MSYLVLARKYRPQAFDEVIEQVHITRTLTNAISSGRVAHAILFSGPRGTGKTTVARILAKAMNCKQGPTPEPCNSCRSCHEITAGHAADVFEIDGASNNSVDQIRELRENIKYMPAHSPYKIYIIDEVHMLSTAAFNALLKTLEEPPSHVMFMFATTEPQKIPITILSRCQRYDFRRIGLDPISSHMASLCRREGFEIAEESLGLIAREAGGSMRDALSLLDQLMTCAQGPVTHEQVLDILGVIDRKIIFDLASSILTADIRVVIDLLDDAYDRGHDLKKLYADLLEHFRNLLVVAMGNRIEKLVDLPAGELEQLVAQAKPVSAGILNHILDMLFKAEASIRLSPQPKLALEMTLIRLQQTKPALSIDVLIDKLDALRQEVFPGEPGVKNDREHPSNTPEVQSSAGGSMEKLEGSGSGADLHSPVKESTGNVDQMWKQICEIVSQKNPSLAANLVKCKLRNSVERTLEVDVPDNGFTINMLQREKNMAVLQQVSTGIFGHEQNIRLALSQSMGDHNQKKKNNQLKQKAISHPLVADAIDIFDGKLVDIKVL
ncbi:MAG: DNA polymerase III subunit gamma/tau [Desulfobacteraceae bacterium]|jgi:DNA polymerase-3 subunit gamma/tau|nr:DNA polymerase III subunit gamma/tau [Desulfobacteraceae bacterium]